MADSIIENSIDAYISRFDSGLRQYLFTVVFNFPLSVGGNDAVLDSTYHVKSTSLPESSYEDNMIPYPGYTLKLAGNRIYTDWTISLYIDKNVKILDYFQKWHDMIFNPETQIPQTPRNYMRTQTLYLLDGNLNSTATYELRGAWPKTIGAVSLDYSSTEIATVDITFSYQYYIRK